MWLKEESNHFIFHFHEGSIAHYNISEIIMIQEQCFQFITDVLGTMFHSKIHYYLCESFEEVGTFYGNDEPCQAFSRTPNEIYATYHESLKCIGFREVVYLISSRIKRSTCVAFKEGLAMFFEKKYRGIHLLDWTLYYLKSGEIPPITSLLHNGTFYSLPSYIAYPIAGAFTEYMITRYNINTFKSLYEDELEKGETVFKQTLGKTLLELEQEFLNYLKLFKLDRTIERRIIELLMAEK